MAIEVIHNEKELLFRVAEGDREAFKELYNFYFAKVQGYVTLFQPVRDEQDELTQDVFVKIWEKRHHLYGVESFRNYLFMITRNTILNYMRSRKVHQRAKDLTDTERTGNDSEDALLYKQYYHIAVEAIEKLPEGRRKVLKMSIDQGLTLDEIAVQLNITRAGVKKQLYAATAFVRQYLLDHGEMSLLLFVFLSLFEHL